MDLLAFGEVSGNIGIIDSSTF